MLNRRLLLTGTGALLAGCSTAAQTVVAPPAPVVPAAAPPPVAPAMPAAADPGAPLDTTSYDRFLTALRAEARSGGISEPTVRAALGNIRPLPRVLELDRKVGEAIDIFVNNRLIARGEVVVVDDRLGVTMTEIIKTEDSGA